MLNWVDIETTGLDAKKDAILEVAIVVTDDDLNELASKSIVVMPNVSHSMLMSLMDDYVREMHMRSGLIEVLHRGPGPEQAEQALIKFLAENSEKSPMCGSSVHFDRAFLKEQMPELEKCFAYRNIDVSTLKELVKRWSPSLEFKIDDKPHRALPDIRASIAELRHYRKEWLR